MRILENIKDFFKNLNLRWKFQIALFVVYTVSLSVMGFFSYYEGRALLSEKSFELLNNIADHKKQAIESYFEQVKNQVLTLSKNPSTRDALVQFNQHFRDQTLPEDANLNLELAKFYRLDFIKALQHNLVDEELDTEFIPQNKFRRILQYKYIAHNPKPVGYKYMLSQVDHPKPYDQMHERYHPSFLNFVKKFEYKDLMLVNLKGDVVYSVAKQVDFATNLVSGPLKNRHIARLFRKVLESGDLDYVAFEDYEFYEPNYYQPVCLVATPIFQENQVGRLEKIGVLIFQISNDKITKIITNDQQWEKDGLGTSGETALIGPDYLLRSNTRSLLTDPLAYQQNIIRYEQDSALAKKIFRLNTTILMRKKKTQAVILALNGKEGTDQVEDFLGNPVLDVYKPIDILGTRWALITEVNASEIFNSVVILGRQLLFIAGILFLSITVLGFFLARTLSRPMGKIQTEITMLSEGRFPKPSQKIYKDELGKIDAALNSLIDNMQNVAGFAKDIGRGNFDYNFNSKGEQDILGNALLQMRDNLKKVSIEESERSWINTGTSLFGEILRNHSDDIQKLAEATIAELVKYLKANQGAFFIWEEETQALRLVSAYAYNKYKYVDKQIQAGEGLVGQAYLEKSKIYLTEIPSDYADISSGLGQASPKSLIVIPIQVNQEIYGVIELASFEQLKPYEITFLEIVSEDIATTISAIKVNNETRKLLEESQKVTEQLRKQEEEMRHNFEELMRSQEEVRKRQRQIDMLVSGRMTLEEFIQTRAQEGELLEEELENDLPQNELEKRVLAVIKRQKELLDKAVEDNQTQEKELRRKLDENGQHSSKNSKFEY